jgi:hypothetical protein
MIFIAPGTKLLNSDSGSNNKTGNHQNYKNLKYSDFYDFYAPGDRNVTSLVVDIRTNCMIKILDGNSILVTDRSIFLVPFK